MDDQFFEEDDLVTTGQPERNWKGIIIAVLVIGSVLALIVMSVVLLTPPDEGPRVKGERFKLDSIFGADFQPLRLNGTWISEKEWAFRDADGGISVLDVTNFNTRVVISNHTFRRFNAASFSVSTDFRFVAFIHDVTKVHRYSFNAKYTLFEIETGETTKISINPTKGRSQTVDEQSTLRLMKWAPQGTGFAMVHDGDIYYKSNPKEDTIHRLSDSGEPGVVFNGVPDWLYEEEIFSENSAMWFSPNAEKLLYLTFNDSLVGEQYFLHYGSVDEPNLYPKVKTLRYPKPGTNNPIVFATLVDLRRGYKKMIVQPPSGIARSEHYITSAGWLPDSSGFAIIWTSRAYNVSIISVCSAETSICEEVYRITTEKRGWVECTQFPLFSKKANSKDFLTIAPVRDGENGFFDHLIYIDSTNKRSHPVTHGSIDVYRIHWWDEKENLIYYTAAPADNPGGRNLYRVKLGIPYSDHVPECLSCSVELDMGDNTTTTESELIVNDIEPNDGSEETFEAFDKISSLVVDTSTKKKPMKKPRTKPSQNRTRAGATQLAKVMINFSNLLGSNKSCGFVSKIKFSKDGKHFMLECAGPDIPFVDLHAINDAFAATAPSNIRLIKTLQSNDALLSMSKKMAFPQIKTFPVHMSGGHTVQVRLLLPPGLREDEIVRFPLLLHVYGGPGTQLNTERWKVDFPTYLASKRDYIIAQVDGRGSGGRGWDFQHKVFHKLGEVETADQIEVVRYLRSSLHFVDPKKIGVWGWSFGGFLTSMIMSEEDPTHLFRCGAAIAPVTNWRLYDSAYTERYMGMPNATGNYKGYEDSNVAKKVANMENKMFYLIHGTADDNVHIHHSMALAKALIAKKILFRQQVYPDEPHGLNGAKIHVHKSLENFFEDCFRKQTPPELGTGLNKGGNLDDYEYD